MTTNTPASGADTGLPEWESDSATEARIAQVAAWLGLDAAPVAYEDGSMTLDDALLGWCKAGGVSLDWIFCGDAKAMALAYQANIHRAQPVHDVLQKFDSTEHKLLIEALAGFKVKVDEYRQAQGVSA